MFVGWNTEADRTGTSYSDGESVKNLTTTNNGIVTLYAQWQVLRTSELDAEELSFDWSQLNKIAKVISNTEDTVINSESETVTVEGTTYTLKIGDTVKVTYNNKDYTTIIIGFKHDKLVDKKHMEMKKQMNMQELRLNL